MIVTFAEHSLRFSLRFRPDGQVRRTAVTRRGACFDEHRGAGEVRHRFADGDALLRAPRRRFSAETAETAARVLERPLARVGPRAEAALRELSRDARVTLVLSGLHQHVAAGAEGGGGTDERRMCAVEAVLEQGLAEAAPWDLTGPLTSALAGAERIVDRLRDRAARRRADAVPGRADVLLAPGRAGAFFHELVGHPMEADVLRSGVVYLRPGVRLGPEWLTVADGAVRAAAGFRARIDDEGSACTEAVLIRRGVVARAMTDRVTAGFDARFRPTGHGRRLDYRHPAIPRMTHTCAFADAPAEPPDREWIEPYGLRPETVNPATGDFSFLALAPTLHRPDAPPLRLPRLRLAGNARTALAALRPADPTVVEDARARRGCGKLGQFPLPVTFANAGMVLPAGTVSIEVAGP
ncbi:metallopeptidase TldD-related protein [Actinomadura chibensis]|uniref:metallopeptidase TldD-related protein n=1 Tax=Actinomadura chibensis TaxID=392828 RepID=UPI000830992E|nr:metallopeptidase TldD-related protein [Actinomadura chibensis]